MGALSQQISTFQNAILPPLRSTPLVSSAQNNTSRTQLTKTVIDIHGGAFMLGNSRMVSLPQVSDCLSRGWIVVVPNHRLCPSVSLLRGPIEDIRDLTWWIQCGNFNTFLEQYGPHRADVENIAAFGTSSGGTLALALVQQHLSRHIGMKDTYLLLIGLRR